MTLPGFLFGLVISTLYGSIFHLWKGGSLWRLLLYLLLGWVGFWSGHAVAVYFHWTFDSLGTLHIGSATAGSFLFIGIGYWLSLVQVDRQEPHRRLQ